MTGSKPRRYSEGAGQKVKELMLDVSTYLAIVAEYGADSNRAADFFAAREHDQHFVQFARGALLLKEHIERERDLGGPEGYAR